MPGATSVPPILTFAEALLEHEAPWADPHARRAAAAHVAESVHAMPHHLGLGVRFVARVTDIGIRASRSPDAASRLSQTRSPLISEYVRLSRGLGLAALISRMGTPGRGDE